MRDTLDQVRESFILAKYSPKREKRLGKIQENNGSEYQTTTPDTLIGCGEQDGLPLQVVVEK